jgi:hypothetical protein
LRRNVAQDQDHADIDTRVQSRNIRWAAAAMAAMLLISGVLAMRHSTAVPCLVLAQCYEVSIDCMSHAIRLLQGLLTYSHAGVAAAMNLREAWISASSFVESYQYMIVKVHYVALKRFT